jgi:hypothetical protein
MEYYIVFEHMNEKKEMISVFQETYTIYAGAGKGKFTMGKLKSSLFFHSYVQRQCSIPFWHEHRNAIGQVNTIFFLVTGCMIIGCVVFIIMVPILIFICKKICGHCVMGLW